MTFQLTLEEGKFLVNLARNTVTTYLKTGRCSQVPEDISPKLKEPCGVFVTLNSVHDGTKQLRGCIGLPHPTSPLVNAIIEAAVCASTRDPRFPPVNLQELDNIVFEISVLTPPELVEIEKPTDYFSKIKVGRDGLILEQGYHKGLLLPQVPVEWKWDVETFLGQTAIKAGLSADSWLVKGTKIYRFEAIIFVEAMPKGEVKRKEI